MVLLVQLRNQVGTLNNKRKTSERKTDYSQNTDSPKTDQWYTETTAGSFSESSFWNDTAFALYLYSTFTLNSTC